MRGLCTEHIDKHVLISLQSIKIMCFNLAVQVQENGEILFKSCRRAICCDHHDFQFVSDRGISLEFQFYYIRAFT